MNPSSSSPWPSLGESHGEGGQDPRNLPVDDDDWELLEDTVVPANAVNGTQEEKSDHERTTTSAVAIPVALGHTQQQQQQQQQQQGINPKMLHHCSSSPDFRKYYQLQTHEETDESCNEDEDSHVLVDDHESTTSSFTMVSNPATAVTTSSTENPTPRRVPSFRDALLLQQEEEQKEQETPPPQEKPKRVKPKMKFVVKPISRRVHSAGDLQGLGAIHENDDEDILGDSDAMDFYHRKSKGACGRSSGMRLRPDEAKRKDMIIHKKNAQRARQAGRG